MIKSTRSGTTLWPGHEPVSRNSYMDWFYKELEELSNRLGRGELTLDEHYWLVKELNAEMKAKQDKDDIAAK